MPIESIESLTQFGVAGLMGVLWVWERMSSRKREAELSQAHRRLMKQREELAVLIRMVRQNTKALERFDQTQQQLRELLVAMGKDAPRAAA